MMCGTTYQGAAGSWQASSLIGTTGTINGAAATTDYMQLTGVVVLPGIELPSPSRAPFIARPISEELRLSKRYYQTFQPPPGVALGNGTTTVSYHSFPFPEEMRVAPNATVTSLQFTTASAGYTCTSVANNYCTTRAWNVNLISTTAVPVGIIAMTNSGAAFADARF
jgi:hypothetical protein